MAIGTVKGFNPTKGCGFTLPDGVGSDAFMHATAVQRAGLSDLSDGQKVSYELVADRRSDKTSDDQVQVQRPQGHLGDLPRSTEPSAPPRLSRPPRPVLQPRAVSPLSALGHVPPFD